MDESGQEQARISLQTESKVRNMDTGMLRQNPESVKQAIADDKNAKRALANSIFEVQAPPVEEPERRTGMLRFLRNASEDQNK